MDKSYICPACNEKQTTVNMWQSISVANEFNLKTDNWGKQVGRSDSADFESWACPCGEDLPEDLVKKLELDKRI